MNEKYKSLFSNTIIFAIGNLGSKIITFFLVPLYTNYLSTAEYGTADLVINFSNLILPIISLVIQDSVLRFGLSRDNKQEEVLKNAFIVFFLGSIFTISMYPFLGLYPAIKEWRLYVIMITITNNACNILFSYTKAKEKNKLFSASGIIQTLVLAGLNILLIAVYHIGVKGYLISNIIAHFATVIFLSVGSGAIRDIIHSKANYKLLKKMLLYCTPLIANNLSWWILNSSDKVMIESYIGADNLGLYTAASKIPNLLSILTAIFASAWTVSSIKEYEDEQDKRFYENIFKLFSLTMFLGGSCLLTITKPFSYIYIGKGFISGWICTPFLIIGTIYFSLSSFFGAVYSAVKKNIPTTISTIIAAMINIGFNIVFIPKIGIIAASISTALSYFAIGIIRMLHSRKYFRFHISFIKFAVNSIVLILQSVFVTLDYSGYISSFICLIVLSIINYQDLLQLFGFLRNRFTKNL